MSLEQGITTLTVTPAALRRPAFIHGGGGRTGRADLVIVELGGRSLSGPKAAEIPAILWNRHPRGLPECKQFSLD